MNTITQYHKEGQRHEMAGTHAHTNGAGRYTHAGGFHANGDVGRRFALLGSNGCEIACGDLIFASMVCNGKTIVNIMETHFACLDEVMRRVASLAGTWLGLAQIKVRNASQGWNTSISVASPRRITRS